VLQVFAGDFGTSNAAVFSTSSTPTIKPKPHDDFGTELRLPDI
jgi:hypothetical protein